MLKWEGWQQRKHERCFYHNTNVGQVMQLLRLNHFWPQKCVYYTPWETSAVWCRASERCWRSRGDPAEFSLIYICVCPLKILLPIWYSAARCKCCYTELYVCRISLWNTRDIIDFQYVLWCEFFYILISQFKNGFIQNMIKTLLI